jgi:hypothetical protein
MINFIQLNQNTLSIKRNILTDEVLENFHNICFQIDWNRSEEEKVKEQCIIVKRKLYEMSIQYNIDKKHLLKKYFHWLIQKNIGVTIDNLKIFVNIVHYTESSAEQQLLYFLLHFSF